MLHRIKYVELLPDCVHLPRDHEGDGEMSLPLRESAHEDGYDLPHDSVRGYGCAPGMELN